MGNLKKHEEVFAKTQELYWNTLGKLQGINVYGSDIVYTRSENGFGPERIFRIDLQSDDVNERLNKIVADIKAGFIPDGFLLSPKNNPSNIRELLLERGFLEDNSGSYMLMELSDLMNEPIEKSGFSVKEVSSDEMLGQWIAIMNDELFEGRVLTDEQFKELIQMDNCKMLLTYYQGKAAAISLTITEEEIGDVSWLATKKEYRRIGLASYTLRAALQALKDEGVMTVALRADSTAIPFYKRFGFEEYGDRIVMNCDYSQVYKKTCCKMENKKVDEAKKLYDRADSIEAFVELMSQNEVIGRKIWYDSSARSIFITKKYAFECGGGCSENDSDIGRICHCGYMNDTKVKISKDYCKCSAEFFRPLFEPLLGNDLTIDPVETVLSGGKECIFSVSGF